MPPITKQARWNLRVAPDADQRVRQAADACDRNLTDFIFDAAISEAERVLADRTRFVVDDRQWSRFVELLDRPVRENPELATLFAKPDVFD